MKYIVKFNLTYLMLTLILSACDSDNKEQATNINKNASESISVKTLHSGHASRAKSYSNVCEFRNTSTHQYNLVAVETDVSEHAEIHEHKHVDGMMQMGQVDQIQINAKSTTELAPGGYHIMLIGLKNDLALGQRVDIKLLFKDGSAITIQPEVKKINVN